MKNKRICSILPKTPNKLFPMVFRAAIFKELLSYEGRLYEEKGPCPACGAKESRKNHIAPNKIFCKLIDENNQFYTVHVRIRYYTCKKCGKVHKAANAPFVPKVDYASPIIDLAFYFSDVPFHHAERMIADLGIQVDRDTIRKLDFRHPQPFTCTGL